MFGLTPAEGALGAHAVAARDAYNDFRQLVSKILTRITDQESRFTGPR